jgi:hypothetical protein
MKIVINKCYGGFGLSDEAMKRYAELKGITLYPEKDRSGLYSNYYTVPAHKRVARIEGEQFYALSMEERSAYNKQCASESLYDRDIPRDDPTLVQVVKELGKKASGRFASLAVVNVPDGVSWEIDEYDGLEQVAETHRTWS